MRIGFDAAILGPATRYSGIGRYSLKLLNHLALIDGSNEYLLYGPPDCPRPADLDNRLQWKPLPRARGGKFGAFGAALWTVPRLVESDRLDLFHVPTVHPRPTWPHVPRKTACPLVVTLHDLIPLNFYNRSPNKMPFRWRLFYRWNLKAAARADLLITVSEASRREILDGLGLRSRRVQVIYNGVDVRPPTQDSTHHLFQTEARPYILYVGSFEPRKNLLRLVRAYKQAAGNGLTQDLVAIADPASGDATHVESELAASVLKQRVHLRHAVSEQDLWELYRRADLFVFPSLAEGFGLPPLEAMAVGTPVIASDLPALREVLADAAHFVDPYSERDLAAAMLELSNNPTLRTQLANSGLSRAGRFTWRDCAEQTLLAYEQLAGRRLSDDGIDTRQQARIEVA